MFEIVQIRRNAHPVEFGISWSLLRHRLGARPLHRSESKVALSRGILPFLSDDSGGTVVLCKVKLFDRHSQAEFVLAWMLVEWANVLPSAGCTLHQSLGVEI